MSEPNYKAHLFVCTNRRDNGRCCASKGSQELRDRVKKAAKERWGKTVRVNSAGCLGQCDEGIAAVVYPQGKWLLNLKGDDDQKLIDALERAQERK